MKSLTANKPTIHFNGFGNYDSRWMIVAAIALALFLFAGKSHAQIASSNPLEYVALAEGNELINAQIKHQITDQQKTAFVQNTIAAEFTKIHEWERKYNSYLKTAEGYASTLPLHSGIWVLQQRQYFYVDLRVDFSKGQHLNFIR